MTRNNPVLTINTSPQKGLDAIQLNRDPAKPKPFLLKSQPWLRSTLKSKRVNDNHTQFRKNFNWIMIKSLSIHQSKQVD